MNYKYLLLVILALSLNSYAMTGQEKEIRKKIVQKARNLIGYKGRSIQIKGRTFRYDCSGFVAACYYAGGLKLNKIVPSKNRSKNLAFSIYKSTKTVRWKNKKKKPIPGDLIFFDNTYDRNKNKKWDDRATHVGIVEKVFPDGRIYWIHLVRKGIVRYVSHLGRPKLYVKNKIKFNDFLRRRPKADKNKGRYLSGNLFSSFASPIPKLAKFRNR